MLARRMLVVMSAGAQQQELTVAQTLKDVVQRVERVQHDAPAGASR